MKDYIQYDVDDFIKDPEFQEWILAPNATSNHFWETFVLEHPEKQHLIYQAKHFLQSIHIKEQKLDPYKVRALKNTIDKRILDGSVSPEQSRLRFREYLKYAASLFIGILGISLIYIFALNHTKEIIVSTDYGQIKKVVLSDGSIVTLNANSTLKYPEKWDSEDREIWLTGEAYFEIKKQVNARKFIVNTAKLNVEVLGTTFNVTSRKSRTQVVLNTGKIKLELKNEDSEKKELVMNPGEAVSLTKNDKVMMKVVNPATIAPWREQKLIFEETSLAEIANILNENYGLEVHLTDEDLHYEKISGEISSKDVEKILYTIKESLNLEITRQNNQIYLNRK